MKKTIINLILIILFVLLSSCSNQLTSPEEDSYPTIGFGLHQDAYVKVSILNQNYEVMKTLLDGELTAGYHSITWEGTNDEGNPVASGIYYYTIITANYYSINELIYFK
ncbi:MAG TPA: FlgD immunoglobulin-like domain containing protein [Candidatus Cloacimonadota bacterium]|nr:FlgD immunoglobulin-like domain containing protein [Candidatus Cloacimonadota bacterium]